MTVIDFIKRGLGSSFKGTVDIGMVFLICIWDIVEEWQRGQVSCKCRNFRTTCVSWMMFTLLFVLIIRVTVASPQTWADSEACLGVLPPGLQAQAPSPESRHVFAVLLRFFRRSPWLRWLHVGLSLQPDDKLERAGTPRPASDCALARNSNM